MTPKAGLRCARCGNTDPSQFRWKGNRNGGKRYQCKRCGTRGGWNTDTRFIRNGYTIAGDKAQVTLETEKRIRTADDLIGVLDLDMTEWEIDRFTVGKSEAYRKDRSVEWLVQNGEVEYGEVHDSGKLLIKPLYSVKVWLRRRTKEIRARNLIAELRVEAQKFAPRYPKIHYPKRAEGLLYEIAIPDLQLGRLVQADAAGRASDVDAYIIKAIGAVNDLVLRVRDESLARILFPIGNDLFDSNSGNTTAHGTPQQDDVRWQRTYLLGKKALIEMIDRLQRLAPVDVLIIPGNHDEEKSWYVGDTLASWYHHCANVTVDNRAAKRKYYAFGKCLLGLTHGYYEKLDTLAALMPCEEPRKWADSVYREFHLGHLHHKQDVILKTREFNNGVVVRVLRSLAPPSVWEFDKGFVGSLQAAEGFLWHPERGVIAQFTAQ